MSPPPSQACPKATPHHQEPAQPPPQYHATSPSILESFSLNLVVRQNTDDQTVPDTPVAEELLRSFQNKTQMQKSPQHMYAAPDPSILSDIASIETSSGEHGTNYDDNVFGQRYHAQSHSNNVVMTHQRIPQSGPVFMQDCNVCAEMKTLTSFPMLSISSQCGHSPQTCLECIKTSIKTDFTTKRWNQIHCPECHALMEYQDIERYADKETFHKYQNLAFREAMNEAPDFVWCPANCGSGQVHEAGDAGPIVRCARCRFKFCFHHQRAWHEELTCDEYDGLLADPLGFRSRIDIANEEARKQRVIDLRLKQEQEDADHRYAQSLVEADQAAEAERRAAKERQERAAREAAEIINLTKEREALQKNLENMRREAVRRNQEEAQSEELVKKTTKPCPSCSWNIEKNEGCAHMTCIKCRYEFCWKCMARWRGPHNGICRG